MADSLHQPVSALEARDAIARGETSLAEIRADLAKRIATHEPDVLAFACLSPATRPLPESGSPPAPLSGLSVAVKDLFDTHDLPTEYGSPIYRGHRPPADASIVTRLRALGADIAGKSVTTEFAYFTPGPTGNPHDIGRTPGGSSSGSAAAVSAGFVHAALGTQTAGSIIRPAAYCGVAGYKPNFGLFPTMGVKTFAASLDTVGLFAKSVADVAFVAGGLSGRRLAVDRPSETPPRVGLYRTPHWNDASADMQAAIDTAARRAERAGATLVDLGDPEELAAADDAHGVIFAAEAADALADEHRRHRDRLSAILLDLLDRGAGTRVDTLDAARATTKAARLLLVDLFKTVDVILTPSARGAAPRGLSATGTPQFNRLWTLMGVPSVNVPGLTDMSGLPLGVQIVGPAGQDAATLVHADWLERLIAG